MHALHLIVTHEHLDQISLKYHLIKEYGFVPPGLTSIIDRPLPGKIGFYHYYFKVGLCVPPSCFFGLIVEAYKIHTYQLKPNSISKKNQVIMPIRFYRLQKLCAEKT